MSVKEAAHAAIEALPDTPHCRMRQIGWRFSPL
jgi:hypothetical protein